MVTHFVALLVFSNFANAIDESGSLLQIQHADSMGVRAVASFNGTNGGTGQILIPQAEVKCFGTSPNCGYGKSSACPSGWHKVNYNNGGWQNYKGMWKNCGRGCWRGWKIFCQRPHVKCNAVKLVPLAEMSSEVYQLHDKHYTELNADPKFDRIRDEGFTVDDAEQQPPFRVGGVFLPAYAVYTRTSQCKQAVLAIKGTSKTSATDLKADLYSVVRGRFPEAGVTMLKRVVEKYQNLGYTVLVTGHSLGGYMGEILSTKYNLPGAVFCAPGPGWHDGPFANPDFQNINAENDVLGNLLPGMYKHKQWSVYVRGNAQHSLTTMIQFLKDRADDLTNANVLTGCSSGRNGYYL